MIYSALSSNFNVKILTHCHIFSESNLHYVSKKWFILPFEDISFFQVFFIILGTGLFPLPVPFLVGSFLQNLMILILLFAYKNKACKSWMEAMCVEATDRSGRLRYLLEPPYISSYRAFLCDSSVSLVMDPPISCLGNINLAADILKQSRGRDIGNLHLPCRFSLNLVCIPSVSTLHKHVLSPEPFVHFV